MKNDNWQTILSIKGQQPDPLPSSIKEENKKIVKMLLEKDPKKRPDAQELLKKNKVRKIVDALMLKI